MKDRNKCAVWEGIQSASERARACVCDMVTGCHAGQRQDVTTLINCAEPRSEPHTHSLTHTHTHTHTHTDGTQMNYTVTSIINHKEAAE